MKPKTLIAITTFAAALTTLIAAACADTPSPAAPAVAPIPPATNAPNSSRRRLYSQP